MISTQQATVEGIKLVLIAEDCKGLLVANEGGVCVLYTHGWCRWSVGLGGEECELFKKDLKNETAQKSLSKMIDIHPCKRNFLSPTILCL